MNQARNGDLKLLFMGLSKVSVGGRVEAYAIRSSRSSRTRSTDTGAAVRQLRVRTMIECCG